MGLKLTLIFPELIYHHTVEDILKEFTEFMAENRPSTKFNAEITGDYE